MTKKQDSGEHDQLILPSSHFAFYDLEASTENDGIYWDKINLCVMEWNEQKFQFGGARHDVFKDMWKAIEWILQQEETCVRGLSDHYLALVAHNGGRYDHLFLWGYVFGNELWNNGWKVSFYVSQENGLKTMELRRETVNGIQTVRLLDSCAIFPAPLWEYGQIIGLKKLERGQEDEVDYCYRDVEILKLTMYHFQKVVTHKLEIPIGIFGSYRRAIFTGTQLTKKVFNHVTKKVGDPYGFLKKFTPLSRSIYDALDVKFEHKGEQYHHLSGIGLSCIGGFVSHNIRGYIPEVTQLDVRSYYPSIMKEPLPYNFLTVEESPSLERLERHVKEGKAVFAWCFYRIPSNIEYAPIPIKYGKTFRPVGELADERFQYWPLIELVLAYGGEVFPKQALIFDKAPFCAPIVDTLWPLRLEAITSGDSATKYIIKIWINAISGAFGQNILAESHSLELENYGVKKYVDINSNFIMPQAYIGITATGQARICDLMNRANGVYADTDGIKVWGGIPNDLGVFNIGDNLGELQVEHERRPAYIVHNKIYAINDHNKDLNKEVWNVTLKTLQREAWQSEYVRDDDGKRIPVHDLTAFMQFSDGMYCCGIPQLESFQGTLDRMRREKEKWPIEYIRGHSPIELRKLWNWIESAYPQLSFDNQKRLQMKATETRAWPLLLPNWFKIWERATEIPSEAIYEHGDNVESFVVQAPVIMYVCTECRSGAHHVEVNLNSKTMFKCRVCGSMNVKEETFLQAKCDLSKTLTPYYLTILGMGDLQTYWEETKSTGPKVQKKSKPNYSTRMKPIEL